MPSERPEPTAERHDVVVVGGGSAGIGAAIGAAQAGASVHLIERYPFLGGAAIASSVLSYCGFFDQRRELVVGGVGGELLARLRSGGAYEEITFKWSGNTVVLIDPEFTKRALDAMITDAGVSLGLHSYLAAARCSGRRITEIVAITAGVERRVGGAVFVDASGDGNLAQAAGASLVVLPAAERQAATLSMRIGGVEPDAPISSELMRQAVAAHNAANERQLGRDHGPAARLPLTGEVTMQIVDQCVDALDAHDLTRAETAARVQAWDYLNAFRNSMPGWQDAYLVATGPQIGVRETRHLVGRYEVTADDVLSARRRPEDGIARCGWPLEAHHGIGSTRYTPIEGRAFYDIPLDALRSIDRDNLWAAGRLVSSDSDAYCSLRVMGTAFATGQAAGVAAALQAQLGSAPPAASVRRELERQGALV
ncbi:MAG TPA: FAD-dependent oxidoreductase [Solirubrobacteraceae bacterium]|nr:FAD-dependent oxidoreductase [Solirubrobacteraceae bacterium]